uniref:RIMS-binding protein 2 n=1 Tax=Panthera onca TaxID=9690 RepID=UPI002955450A|nr:RIMS-binding protein 2 [Panthera onca]
MMRASREKELKDAIQGKHHLRPHYAGLPARGWQPHKVKTEHAWLQHVLAIVTRERDLAVKEKRQLQAKLENLEQVLKHMREAAERRQQLELEHEQALAVLHAKQQEIDLLQKSKVRELEEKCRTQSEQFSLLSQDLERLRQHAGKIDLLGVSPGVSVDVPAPGKPFPPFMNGLSPSIGKGQESTVGSRTVTGDYIRPLPLPGDKPEPLPIKPTFLSRSASPRCRFESDMDHERSSGTSKQQRHSGKVHLCVARYSYNPFDGPNENPEAELPLTAGKYLYVYGDMDEDGFYEGELLDGQRGLVPSNFVDFVQDNESRPASTLGNEQDQNLINRSGIGSEGENILDLHAPTPVDAGVADGGAETLGGNVDDVGEDIVPYPRKITLIKQLARSVIVAWEPPAVPPGWGTVSSYSVLVDQEPRVSLTLGSRTKALIEKLDTAACTYRISVQCATSRGHSDELRCTLLVGKDVAVAPSQLRVDNITQISAQLSWLPANSNYSHVIFLNEEELDVVRAASYTYQFFNLRPNVAYKVKVLARPHQMPWQLPLEQREKKEAFVEFSTLPAGPPAPPQDVTVHAGPTPATVQVSWKPPALTTAGLSNGANVTGYGVYAKGQRVSSGSVACGGGACPHLLLEGIFFALLPQWDGHVQALVTTDGSHTHVCTRTHAYAYTRARTRTSRGLPSLQGRERVAAQPGGPDSGGPTVSPALGPQPHCCHGDEYHTESSRGSDLSDIMEEDEEELCSETQLEDGGRRRPGGTSHNALKECFQSSRTEGVFPERPDHPQQTYHSKGLFSIPEVAEDGEQLWFLHKQGLGYSARARARARSGDEAPPASWLPAKPRGPGVGPHAEDFVPEDRGCRFGRSASRSPDSGLDCGSDEEELHFSFWNTAKCSPGPGHCRCRRSLRPLLARRRTLTRQSSIEEDFGEQAVPGDALGSDGAPPSPERATPGRSGWEEPLAHQGSRDVCKKSVKVPDSRATGRQAQPRPGPAEGPLILGNPVSAGRADRADHAGRRFPHGSAGPQRSRPVMVPCIDEYSERDHLSPDFYEESETDPGTEELPARIFVALFDYDPLTMSPNPDAAEEELPFKEGQIIKVYGDKDADGFYRGETCARLGLIPCNMVSEIQADDEDMMDQLLRQGFLPLNTPVEKIERSRRGGRHPGATRRVVALYDYDPRESSPNIDVEAELTFCTGDIITVFGDIDEDGFYYGELNGQKGLVPSNFLEEVPDDVEVYLSDAPCHYSRDAPPRSKAKRVPPEGSGTARRASSPSAHLHSGSPTSSMGTGSPGRGREMSSKKKKGLLSKGKKLLKRLGAVK